MRGEIGIFNRSHYGRCSSCACTPIPAGQAIDPAEGRRAGFWKQRMADISGWELQLGRSGTRIVKFFLHLSKEEQRERFLARARESARELEVSPADIREREHWDAYQAAYQAALRATSSDHAPWYVIPADHKWLMRTAVASILVHHLEDMDPPTPSRGRGLAAMDEAVRALEAEG